MESWRLPLVRAPPRRRRSAGDPRAAAERARFL